MNNRGQSLIVFILLLPIITMFLAFFIDSSLSYLEKNKIDGIITSNMSEALNNDIRDSEKIKNAINKNSEINFNIVITDDTLKINANTKHKSIFAKILNFSWYKLEFNYCGNYIDKKIDKKCG